MTIFMNVTDAVGEATTHGITRTEHKLASALAPRRDVQFVMMHRGNLRVVTKESTTRRLDRREASRSPRVERYGVDPEPRSLTRVGKLRDDIRRWRRAPAEAAQQCPLQLEPLKAEPGDSLVSVGVDWIRDVVGEAERLVFSQGFVYTGFCYDLIPIDHPEWLFPSDSTAFRHHYSRVSRVASSVVCISNQTRLDFARHHPSFDPQRIKVLRLGSDAVPTSGPDELEFAESIFGGEPYAIYCGTIDRRKNHQLLYRVSKELARRGMPGNVLFVGMMGSGVADLIDAVRHDSLIAGRLAHVSNCDDAHLSALYQRAAFAVYPSLYEGWGLGVTEALAHGKACLIASGSSLAEAGLGICRELHPLKTHAWADAMSEFFADPPEVAAVPLPTWADSADALVQLVQR